MNSFAKIDNSFFCFVVKVEEGCQLGSVDDIATAVHNLLRMIDDEASLCC